MTGTRPRKPARKAEKPQVAILPTTHNALQKQVAKVARLRVASSRAMRIVRWVADKERGAQAT